MEIKWKWQFPSRPLSVKSVKVNHPNQWTGYTVSSDLLKQSNTHNSTALFLNVVLVHSLME